MKAYITTPHIVQTTINYQVFLVLATFFVFFSLLILRKLFTTIQRVFAQKITSHTCVHTSLSIFIHKSLYFKKWLNGRSEGKKNLFFKLTSQRAAGALYLFLFFV